jgi:hypothetical protein
MWIARLVHPVLFALAVCLGGVLAAAPASAETRVALVMGNSAYAHGGRLTNPANDAAAIAQSLRKVGFTVVLQTDLGKTELEAALKSFTRAAAGADIALVYFAGHGVEKGGTNYLIPVDATLASDADIDFEAVPLDLVMHAVSGATKLKIVILDACRNNPFRDAMRRSAGTRGIGQGLAKPPDPEEGDMLVAYAAEAGSTAEDGTGANSPFAAALARHLADPAVDIRIMFGRIRDDVRAATGMRQEPAVYESLGGEQFFMAPGAANPAAETRGTVVAAQSPPTPPDAKTMDLTFWQSVRASRDPVQLKAYLDQYPDGAFAAVAKAKIAALQAGGPGPRMASASRSQIVGDQAAVTAAPGGVAAAGAGEPTGAPPGPGRPSRFDGLWRVTQTCPTPANVGPPVTPLPFTVTVRAGHLHGDRGAVSAPGWMALDGMIGPAGGATLNAHGLVGRTPVNPNPPNLGMPYQNVVTAHFNTHQGAGEWVAKRVCQFAFTRE